jgi:XTP/dITP diphosphohydrolase
MADFVLAVATGNPHKIREIQAVLGPLGVRALTAAEAGAPADFSPEENGATFEANSRIKALALLDALSNANAAAGADHGVPRADGVIADDSGLCVDALGGAPGIYSARFADMSAPAESRQGSDARNNTKLLRLLEGTPDAERTARFVCVITLILPGGSLRGNPVSVAGGEISEVVCRGECEGIILTEPRGSGGFGYDPVFVPADAADTPGTPDTSGVAGIPDTPGQGGRTFAEMAPEEKNAISHRARALAKLYEALSERA